MSNLNQQHPSTRVMAPPGGRSNNIFGTEEQEQAKTNKSNHMSSDIFGFKQDAQDAAAKQTRGRENNNIFGNANEQPKQQQQQQHHQASNYSDKNKSSIFDPQEEKQQQTTGRIDRQRSNVFGSEEATAASAQKTSSIADQHKRAQQQSHIFGDSTDSHPSASNQRQSDKNRSNVFGSNDGDTGVKRQQGRQGLRVGYNPISGESYSPKDGLNPKLATSVQQEPEDTSNVGEGGAPVEEEENGHHSSEQHQQQQSSEVNGKNNSQANGGNHHQQSNNGHGGQQANNANGNMSNAGKPIHTSSRVLQPPGGKDSGRLW